MDNLVQQRKEIIESWNTTWDINKTSKSGPMNFRYIYPFLLVIMIPGFVLTNYSILNEFLSITEKFTWNSVAFFTAIMTSLVINAHHRYHLKSYLHQHYHDLESNNVHLSKESNKQLLSLIKFNRRPVQLLNTALGALIMLIGFVSYFLEEYALWQLVWPVFIIFEIFFFFNTYKYFKKFWSIKAVLDH